MAALIALSGLQRAMMPPLSKLDTLTCLQINIHLMKGDKREKARGEKATRRERATRRKRATRGERATRRERAARRERVA